MGKVSFGQMGRRFLLWRLFTYMLAFFFFFFAIRHVGELFPANLARNGLPKRYSKLPLLQRTELQLRNIVAEQQQEEAAEEKPPLMADRYSSVRVLDAVALPENVLLLVKICNGCSLEKQEILCSYAQNLGAVAAISAEPKEPGIALIRCPHPPKMPTKKSPVTIKFKDEPTFSVPSEALYPDNFAENMLVYEAVIESDSVLLMVKGLNLRSGRISYTENMFCVFGFSINATTRSSSSNRRFRRSSLENLDLGKNVYRTSVIMAAQEILRCQKPRGLSDQELDGMKVSVWELRRGLLPSVARINLGASGTFMPANGDHDDGSQKLHRFCACTMIWNQASFLPEWIIYHAYLGISRWFLYDNNSDDDFENVVESLQQNSFNVSRHAWPWLKSQQAGFSHCALRARQDCTWVAFMDVDEFLNPIHYILEQSMPELMNSSSPSSSSSRDQLQPSVMERISNAVTADPENSAKPVAEIRFDCHSFGPSGLKKSPIEGQIAGYDCRMNRTERHKSIVRVGALNQSLINVVHHFHLDQNYRYVDIPRGFAVINHYKYQVWEIFKAKFYRRVATYVSDWKESQNEGSNDRAPGLGTEAIEPSDWHQRFCESRDTVLRNFTLQTFTDPWTQLLPWQPQFR